MRAGYCYSDEKGLHCAHWWGDNGRCCHCKEDKVESLKRQTPDEFKHRATIKFGEC